LKINQSDYVYAVARIRCKEGKLFSSKHLEQMISMPDVQSVLRFLSESGWSFNSLDDLFPSEEKALWDLMSELIGDISDFDFMRVNKDFHNLKVCIKSFYSNCDPTSMLMDGGITDPFIIFKAIKEKDYSLLPEYLTDVADEALSFLLRTADGQICDMLIDKACLDTVYKLQKKSSDKIVHDYCELYVACADIKIAVRCSKLNKSFDFIRKYLSACNSLDLHALALAASKSSEEICAYLLSTVYKESVPYIKESLASFEKWCDNYIMNKIRAYKSDPFTIASLVGYVFAKETELKAVRLIVTAKQNGLDNSIIRERIRKMYV